MLREGLVPEVEQDPVPEHLVPDARVKEVLVEEHRDDEAAEQRESPQEVRGDDARRP